MEPEPGAVRLPGGETVPFVLHRSDRRTKTISLRIRDDGTLAIRAPRRTGMSELAELLAERAEWIAKGRSEVAEARQRAAQQRNPSVPYLGDLVPLAGGIPPLHVMGSWDIESDAAMTPIERQRRLEEWFFVAARLELPPRVESLAPVVGAFPSRVVISHQRTAWGSCARDGTIRLSWRLMMLRPALIEAVIVHELCHLLQHNHSPRFWREVERVLPDHRALRAELREAQRGLPF